MFWQAEHEILSGHLLASEKIVLKLAALVFQGNFGAPSTINHRSGFICAGRISQYIPMRIIADRTPSEWERLVTDAHDYLSRRIAHSTTDSGYGL